MFKKIKIKNLLPSRKKLKRKISFGIIPILALAVFLMPVSQNLKLQKVGAAFKDDFVATITTDKITSKSVEVNIVLKSTRDGAFLNYINDQTTLITSTAYNNSSFQVQISDNENFSNIIDYEHPQWAQLGYSLGISGWGIGSINDLAGQDAKEIKKIFGNLQPQKNYFVRFTLEDENGNEVNISNPIAKFQTQEDGKGENPEETGGIIVKPTSDSFYVCDRLWLGNAMDLPCQLTRVSYYLIFVPISWIAGFAGKFMDFFFYYSTNSASYQGPFMGTAWGAVRDIANVFFIIALLYVAIKTILSMGGHDSKKIIVYIILFALLINFSLFVTQVVIDASNILAKVFYNNIKVENTDKTDANNGPNGEKNISAGLVSKFDPQTIFTDAGVQKMTDNLSLFFLLTILMSAISAYMIYMFVSIALIFVGRVVGLWIAMIFSPIAFASYALPFEIPGLGHKKWWGDLLKQAFLAPIFIFFLYIVYLFAGGLKGMVADVKVDTMFGMTAFMKVIIPMAIVFGLLQQAKKLAVQYSGEMGQAVSKIGALVGGAAVGVATGGAAILGRGVIGRTGAAMANSKWANRWATEGNWVQRKIGLAARDTGKAAAKGSFDLRGVKVAGKSLGSTGLKVNALGGPNKGGFEKMREDKIAKRQRRAEGLEVGKYEAEKLALNKVEMDLQKLMAQNGHELEILDKKIKSARENFKDLDAGAKLDPDKEVDYEGTRMTAKEAAVKANAKLTDLRGEKKARKDAGTFTKSNGETVDFRDQVSSNGRSISQLEDEDIPHAHHAIETANKARRERYAKDIESKSSKAWNKITSLGQYSSLGADEAAYRIRMEQKAPPKATKESNDGHGSSGHSAPAGGHAPSSGSGHSAPAGGHAPSGGSGHGGGGGSGHGSH